jgi:predicted MFS family arabinose efflux permease
VNRWLILGVLFFARTAMGFQFQSVAAVSPLLVEALALDFALLGALIGIWMLPGVIVAIPGGLLGRRFGDKQVVLAGLALMVIGSFVVAAADGYAVAMVGRVVSGAGAVMLNVLLAKMAADWFHDRELATAMGLLVLSWPLGIGLALILLGPLAGATSWSFAVQVTAWVCIAALLALAFIYRQPPPQPGPVQTSWRLSRRDFALAFVAGLIWTLYNVAYIVVVSFAPVLLAARGLEAASASVIASFATWPLMLTLPIGGYMADRSGRGQAIMIGCFIAMAATMPLMLAAPSPLVMLAIFGLMAGPAGGIIAALPGRVLGPQARHLGLGVFFTLYYLGMALLPALAGWFRDATRIDSAPLIFGSALMLVAVGLVMLFRLLEAWQSA